jgi:aminoglycoside phosphotransferase family enzyme/predicted kinase
MAVASASIEAIMAFLQQPSSYPHHPMEVRLLQTHASVVAMAPPYVYKVKKHVDLGFLDFTSLEKRKNNCEREVTLNSRFCPDLYVAIVPICVKQGQLHFGAEGQVVDYALQMKQLPHGYFMDQLLKAGKVTTEVLEAVLAELSAFYQRHPPSPSVSAYGDPALIRGSAEENISTLQLYIKNKTQRASLEAIAFFQYTFLEKNQALLERRVQQKKIQDCHGDLHLDHIHIQQGRVCIFDCIEFNDRFRYIDVASDIAFLAMDLDFNNRPDLALYTHERMAELLHDPDMRLLMDFYKCYRACVRAKVERIASAETEVPAPDRITSRVRARKYQRLALRYALTGSKPAVLIICGKIGSGKSGLAKKLASVIGCAYLCSDMTRKVQWGQPLYQRTTQEHRVLLYTREATDKVYKDLLSKATAELKAYRSVVVDATFGQSAHRAEFKQAFDELQVPYYFLEMQASDEVIRKRLAKREQYRQVMSDARLEDFLTLSSAFQELAEIPAERLVRVDADLGTNEILAYVLKRIQELRQQNDS